VLRDPVGRRVNGLGKRSRPRQRASRAHRPYGCQVSVRRASDRRVSAVGAVLRDPGGRVLLVLRGNEPDRGTWSLPGGRVEPGEQAVEAIVREMLEETGLHVRVLHKLGQVERAHPEGGVYVIDDFEVSSEGGTLAAGDDAMDVRWFSAADVSEEPMTPGLVDHLRSWGVISSV